MKLTSWFWMPLVFSIGLALSVTMALQFQTGKALAPPRPVQGAGQRSGKASEIDDLLQTLEGFNQKVAAEYLRTGWLHIVSQNLANFGQTGGELPNGTTIPGESLDDSWFLLDENGHVLKAVQLMRGLDGAILQASVYHQGGNWFNLTIGEEIPGSPVTMDEQNINTWFTVLVETSSDENSLSQDTVILNDMPYLLVRIGAPLSAEQSNPASQPYTNWEKRAYYDAETGLCFRVETVVTGADGSERVANAFSLEIIENVVELPDEISQYLDLSGDSQ
jgi:hypothetical protein